MEFLKNITIKNFRGFEHLSIDDFRSINIFVGKNNSGKSSILEAIFLMAGMSNPLLPGNINKLRGLATKEAGDFKYLFHKLNLNNRPEFNSRLTDNTVRSLTIIPQYKNKRQQVQEEKTPTPNNIATIDASTSTPDITGLILAFSPEGESKKMKNSITIDPPNIVPTFHSGYKENMHAVFITSEINQSNVLSRFSDIIKKKKENFILKAIQQIDPGIESVHPLPDGLFFGYHDMDELVPVNIAGDGIRRYLNILATIADKKDSIVLIDEIENGLHYSAHKILWKSIISLSRQFNVQLFVTSHNIEALKCLSDLVEENTELQNIKNQIAVFKVDHTSKAGAKTYRYDFEAFNDAINTNTEIR
jgi:AAA15 family ATPase/GTPase